MNFGRSETVDGIDFKLPPDHPDNALLLKGKRKHPQIYVGCPIWTHKEWVGKIYPANAKEKDFLSYYAQQYNAIELNATHYKIPSLSQVARWVADVPQTFKFCPKVPQVISHAKDIFLLKEVFEEFIDAVLHFENNLGCTFLQLPSYFKPDRISSLIKLLDVLPEHFEMAIELRHEDWFKQSNDLDELATYLKTKKMSLVITDVSARRDVLHQRLTNTTAFIRFTANDLHPSDFSRIDDWTNRLADWLDRGLEKLFFFVHTPEKSLNPELAYNFITQLNKKAGTIISPPKPLFDKRQGDLFK